MEKEFVTHDQAMRLKALGFDEDCLARYEGKIKHIEKPLVFEFTFANLPGAENKVGYPDYPYKDVEAPTFSQAFRWFREKYELSCSIELTDNSRHYYFDFTISDSKNRDYNDEDCFDSCKRIYDDGKFGKYEEAESACLDKLIEIVETKNK